MNPLALPKRYYETERKPVHLVGYTLSLGMMAIGLVETLILRGEKGNLRLGIITLIAGGVAANEYLKEAGVDY